YLSAIAAMAANNVIGRGNALIWHLSEDLKHFKKTTIGKPVIMGRKSYESLGKPLPGRPNIVISRSAPAAIPAIGENGPFYVPGIEEALAEARTRAAALGVEEIFIIGGGEIYAQTLPLIDRLYLTVLHREYDGDAHF